MSWTNRLIGFGICTGLAILLIILVSVMLRYKNSSSIRIGYSVIVALTGLPIGYGVIVALTGLPIGYSVIVALTGLPIGYSVIVALVGLPIGYGTALCKHYILYM